jgi:peptide/nickel transport system ATP-binding protein
LVPDDRCRTDAPELLEAEGGHSVRCHIPPAERKRLWLEEVQPKL